MSEFYQAFVLLSEAIPTKRAVSTLNRIFEENDYMVDEDCLLILNDIDDEEFEPEEATDRDDALKKLEELSNWPTLGSMEYFISNVDALVTFLGCENGSVDAIEVSFGERTFERIEDSSKQKFKAVLSDLHKTFKASRTIMEWGLFYKGFRWKEELARIRQGTFLNSYEIIDLFSEKEA